MPSKPLTPARWLATALTATVALAGAFVGVNVGVDQYAYFRDAHGVERAPFGGEPTTKLIYSYNYIPANFDALLIGSSVTDDWPTHAVQGYRMYNASLDGGNGTEGRLLLDNTLARGKILLVVVAIYPILTETHGRGEWRYFTMWTRSFSFSPQNISKMSLSGTSW